MEERHLSLHIQLFSVSHSFRYHEHLFTVFRTHRQFGTQNFVPLFLTTGLFILCLVCARAQRRHSEAQ